MTDFNYTPAVLRWIRVHARLLNEADMAGELGCQPSTLQSICRTHSISLCEHSDKHTYIRPVPAMRANEPKMAAAAPQVHPRLNPALRGNTHCRDLTTRVENRALAAIDMEAARRRTSPKVLAAVVLEIVATENLFDAVLALED